VLLAALRGVATNNAQPISDTRAPNALTYALRDNSMDAALAGKPSPETAPATALRTEETANALSAKPVAATAAKTETVAANGSAKVAPVETAKADTPKPAETAKATPAAAKTETVAADGSAKAAPAETAKADTPKPVETAKATPAAAKTETVAAGGSAKAAPVETAKADTPKPAETAKATDAKKTPAATAETPVDATALKADIAALKADVLEMNSYLSGNEGVVNKIAPAPNVERQLINISPYSDTIYYEPNETKNPVAYSIPTLDAIGKKLLEDGALIVIVRGYAAPAGTVNGQHLVSEERAKYCADYLHQKWNIDYKRMQVEWYGAARKSEQAENYSNVGYNRAVDLVVLDNQHSELPNEEMGT
jgi:outer membrane protein OmpA-like peptidoglycan-associated protein